MGIHVSTVPSMNGSVAPAFSTTSSITIGAKEAFNKLSLFRDRLEALVAFAQVYVKVFVFVAIVLWPWESAW